jgi:threo-3-hydroxy-L-aspartate ammonia-lyase
MGTKTKGIISARRENMFAKIKSAAEQLSGHAHRTPLFTSRTLNDRVGAEIFLKGENFQRIGAFKFRGAFNAISRLSPAEKTKGIITYSSGNHAQAVALVGRLFSVKTTVVMPENAPAIKHAATKDYGAKIVTYDPETTRREALCDKLIEAHDYTLIPPYDHEDVICGQGTAALEIFEELTSLDMLLVPCGGGGLLSGSAIAAKGMDPHCRVVGIEPEVADDATRSFHTGILHRVSNPPTVADGTRTPSLGKITFPLVRQYVDDMQTVSETAIMDAVKFLFYRLKLVVEPSGALGLAALISGVIRPTGCIGVILSGGNIDADTMADILKS